MDALPSCRRGWSPQRLASATQCCFFLRPHFAGIVLVSLAMGWGASMLGAFTYGTAAKGLPWRRSISAAAFHFVVTVVQATLWWRFTDGAALPWLGWLLFAVGGGGARAALRVWTVVLDDTEDFQRVEDAALVAQRPAQKVAFRFFYAFIFVWQVLVSCGRVAGRGTAAARPGSRQTGCSCGQATKALWSLTNVGGSRSFPCLAMSRRSHSWCSCQPGQPTGSVRATPRRCCERSWQCKHTSKSRQRGAKTAARTPRGCSQARARTSALSLGHPHQARPFGAWGLRVAGAAWLPDGWAASTFPPTPKDHLRAIAARPWSHHPL